MNRQECFINGFVKQALEYGFSEKEIVEMYNHKLAEQVVNTLASKKPIVGKKPVQGGKNFGEQNDSWRPSKPSLPPFKRLPGENEYE